MPIARSWELVNRGLDFKLAGLILFVGLPLFATLLWFIESDPRWLLLGVGLAAVPDFAGRCLCLAAPIPTRLTITLSVVFQFFAFSVFAILGFMGGTLETSVGIVIACGLQITSAALFTRFVHSVGKELRAMDVTKRAEILNWRLAYSLIASSGLGLGILFAACIVLFTGCLTCGVGFYIAAPLAAAAIVPLLLLTIGVLAGMYWAYGSTLLCLKSAIRKRIQQN